MTGNIRNRNVRFYEEKEADRRAWEILHSEAVRVFPSQNDFIIQAINDFIFDELASQRYYLPISFPPHQRQVEKCQSGKAMWKSRTERRARGGFRLEAVFLQRTD